MTVDVGAFQTSSLVIGFLLLIKGYPTSHSEWFISAQTVEDMFRHSSVNSAMTTRKMREDFVIKESKRHERFISPPTERTQVDLLVVVRFIVQENKTEIHLYNLYNL